LPYILKYVKDIISVLLVQHLADSSVSEQKQYLWINYANIM